QALRQILPFFESLPKLLTTTITIYTQTTVLSIQSLHPNALDSFTINAAHDFSVVNWSRASAWPNKKHRRFLHDAQNHAEGRFYFLGRNAAPAGTKLIYERVGRCEFNHGHVV